MEESHGATDWAFGWNVPEEQLYPLEEHARSIANNWSGSQRDHLVGLMGESSFAQPLGMVDRLDFEVYADGGDGSADFPYRGATVDVKTVGRHRKDPTLAVGAYEPLNADYYALASRISETGIRLIGYAPRRLVANVPVCTHQGDEYQLVGQEYLFLLPQALL